MKPTETHRLYPESRNTPARRMRLALAAVCGVGLLCGRLAIGETNEEEKAAESKPAMR